MPVLSYTPSHVDREVLERLTAGASRRRLIETLVEAVRAEVGRATHQHHLLIGPRGSGKTHALTLVAHRLQSDPDLGSRTLPLLLAEEEVARHPADLMRKILEKLADRLADLDGTGVAAARKECREALAVLRSEGDDERALEIAVGALEGAAAALDRLLITVVENFDSLLYSGPALSRGTAVPGQWALRRALLASRGLLLVAAAPSFFGEVCDPRAPFYDFFRVHQLDELPPEEMLDLIRTRLAVELENGSPGPRRRERLEALADHFEERSPKLRGTLTLTGGLPRFAHLLFDLVAETDVRRTVDVLARFLDEQTPYFQTRLDPRLIPEAELEVLDFLATSGAPRTPSEIAAGLRAKSPNVVSTYLKRLRERHLVRQAGTSRRDVRYDVAEPLFRVWRRFRLGRTEREQIVLLAEIIAALFAQPELEADWKALEGIPAAAFRRQVIEAALERHGSSLAPSDVGTGKAAEMSEGERLIQAALEEVLTGSVEKAYELFKPALEEVRQQGDRWGLMTMLIIFAHLGLRSGRTKEALAIAQEAEQLASEIGDNYGGADALFIRGMLLDEGKDPEAALEVLQQAETLFLKVGEDLGRADVLMVRAEILCQLGDTEAALQALQEAGTLYHQVGSASGRVDVLADRGHIFFYLGDNTSAFEAYKEAESLLGVVGDDVLANYYWGYGRLVCSQGDWETGIEHLLTAYNLARKTGIRRNVRTSRSAIWLELLRAGLELPPQSFYKLLSQAGRLVEEVSENEEALQELTRFGGSALVSFGPEPFLAMLPVLEAHLPTSHADLLRPIRLAAEIRAGRIDELLAEEAEEMRRAVREILSWVEASSRNKPARKRSPAKKKRPHSNRGRKKS